MHTTLQKNDPEKAYKFFSDKMAFTTGPVELARRLKQASDLAVIDVREPEDFRKGHIPGAVNLPHDKWSTRQGLRKESLNVLYCYSHVCHLAATAAVEFARQGFSVMEMEGGFEAWKENDLEIENEVPASEGAWKKPAAVAA